MIVTIVVVEAELFGVSMLFLCPVALMQALTGRWLGLRSYVRAGAWGALFLLVCLFPMAALR